jgi:hypothetical protein
VLQLIRPSPPRSPIKDNRHLVARGTTTADQLWSAPQEFTSIALAGCALDSPLDPALVKCWAHQSAAAAAGGHFCRCDPKRHPSAGLINKPSFVIRAERAPKLAWRSAHTVVKVAVGAGKKGDGLEAVAFDTGDIADSSNGEGGSPERRSLPSARLPPLGQSQPCSGRRRYASVDRALIV